MVRVKIKMLYGPIDKPPFQAHMPPPYLMRSELTETLRSEHLAKRKELWEARREAAGATCPTSLADGRKAGPQHEKQFASETAAATGTDKRTVTRAISRAENVSQEARDVIRGTKADTGAVPGGL